MDGHLYSYITKLKKEKTLQLILEYMPTWVVPQVQNPHFRKLSNLLLGIFGAKNLRDPQITYPWIGVFKSYF